MFRRSRFSIRPNVGTAGRTAATPQEAPSANQEASENPKDVSESSTATAVTDDKSVVTLSEKPTASGDGNDQNGEGTSSSAALQRRKRFSIKPKVAPGRPSTLARTQKSPVKAVSETSTEVPVSDLDKSTTSSQTGPTAAPQRLQSPRRRRPSEESKQPKIQPKPTLIPSDSSEPSAPPTAEDSPEQPHLPTDSGKELESTPGSQVKEVLSKIPDKVPPSLPDKEAIEISEKAKTLVSSKCGLSVSAPAFSLSRLLNDPSDLQRLAKAQKLRELLKQEMNKEKKMKKAKARTKEYTIDPAKMTMRDLIRYLPLSNPMTSNLEESAQENETVVPPSPAREESPERAQQPEVPPKIASPREEEEAEPEAEAEEEEDDGIMVPQVKVAEDGSLIIDEESLTVEVQRAKGPNPAQDRDPIFERGSTTTYSSFRKGTYSKPWSSEETDMFFLAISMVGTDFSMICQLFPHRARSEIKNKFKKEERENAWRIDKAFRERRKLDIEYFSKLLEKILEVQKNRKKLKSLAGKKSPKKPKRKAKDKKAARKLSVVEEEDEEEQNEIPDLEEEEGEKENEDLCNEGGTTVAKPKKKRKRKSKQDDTTEEPNDKKNKTGQKSNEQDEAYIPEDTEAALPEDRPNSDMAEKTENVNAAKNTTIKPAKLSRGRAPTPLLPLGRKWGKKPPPPSTKANDSAPDKGDESVIDGASEEQVNKDASPNKRKSANDDISSEEEDATVQPPRPTRYGRVPKPTKPLNYPAKEAAHSSETIPASPAGSTASAARPKPKGTAKRGRSSKPQSAQESKRPKLVTLRASQSEYSDDEDEMQREEEVEEEEQPACSYSKDSTAPVFVPASLRSPHPVISEVEETMEELDILANMPDVLGISQDALCPDASCEQAQNETGTVEPCEHQLDLLVDVIDFLSSEHTEVSEDASYNEAAQTLLTIGNLTHLSQSAVNQIAIQDHITVAGTTSVSVNKTSQHREEEIGSVPAAQEEKSATPVMSETFGRGVTETSENVTTVELQNSTTDNDDVPNVKFNDQSAGSDMDPTRQLHSSPEGPKNKSPQTRKGRLPKVKPKPNLGQVSRTGQSKSIPETSTVQTAEESCTVAPDHSQASETLSPTEEAPKTAECSQELLKDTSCIEAKLTGEPFGIQPRSGDHVKSGAATSDQSTSGNQNLSEAQFEPSREQATTDTRPTSESTDEKVMSHFGTTENSCKNALTSDSAATESQVGQGLNRDSVPAQESSDHSAPCVTPVEELPVSQKEESKVASACQTRRSRFQKVRPNLAQTSRTVRSKPETTKVTLEKDSNQTPKPKVHEKTIVEVEAEPTCTTSPENPSQSHDPASDLTPSLDVGCTLPPTEEMSSIEDKKTNVEVVGQVASDGATSAQSTSENCFSSEAQLESSSKQATTETRTTSESTHEKQMSHVGITESICNDPLAPDSALSESQVGQASDTAPIQGSSGHPALCATPAQALPVSQKEESEVESTCQSRRGRLQKVKPKPNLPQRTVRSKPQTTKDPASPMQFAEKPCSPTSRPESTANTTAQVEAKPTCSTILPEAPSRIKNTDTASVSLPSLEVCSTHKTTDELFSTEEQKTDVVCRLEPESSEQNVSQRRQRFPKVKPKPNLGSSLRTTHTKLQSNDIIKPSEQCHTGTSLTSEQQPLENNNAQTEVELTTDSKHLTSTHCSLHSELSSTMLASTESGKSLDSINDKDTSSDGVIITASWVAENQSVLTDSVLENESTEKPTVEEESTMDKMSNYDKVEAGPASQWDCQQDTSIRATETNTQPTDNPTAVSDIQCSEGGSAESKIEFALPTNTQYTTDPKEGAQLPQSENDSEAQSQDSVQQCSETNQTAAKSTDNRQSEPVDCPSRKPALTCRGWLIKPKPSLSRSSRPRQPQQVQHTKQAEAEGMDASACKPVSEHQPEILEPAEGAIEQCSDPNSPPNDSGSSLGCLTQVMEQLNQHDSTPDVAGSSLGCVKQVPYSFTQDASTSSTGGTQSHPSLTIFPDMLPQQEPSDPDEPFFILSLTEIPVCSAGEVLGSVPEPLPYLPVTDASVEQQSNPGESLAAAGGGLLSNVAVPVSMVESEETGLINVIDIGPDPTAYIGSIMENPVDPHENTTVHPSKLPETIENNETEIAPTKQRLMSIRGRGPAQLQVESNTTKRKEASKALAAKEAEPIPIQTNTTLHSELLGPSVQPKALDDIVTEQQKGSGDHVHAEKETLTGGEDPENTSSGALIKRTRGATGRNRKSKETNDTAPSDSPPGKAASKGAKVKTQRAARKRFTPASVASTSYDVAPTPRPTQPTEETHSTSSTASPTHTQVHLEQTSEHSRLCSDTTPITPLCPAEVSASQQSLESSSIEEEPTSVSQYFLSDIFTEVEDG